MFLVSLFGITILLATFSLYALNKWAGKRTKNNNPSINPPPDVTKEELGKFPLVFSKKPPVVIAELERYQHIQILGGSGFGKTSRGVLPAIYQDIHNGAGVFVLDVKSNMRDVVASYAQSAGRIREFYYFDIKDKYSMSYSPFIASEASAVSNRVYKAFFGEDQTPTPYFRETALAFLRPFFTLCYQLGSRPTFLDIHKCASSQKYLAALCDMAPQSEASRILNDDFLEVSAKSFKDRLQGFVNKLAPFVDTDSNLYRMLNTTEPDINIQDIITKGKILVFGVAKDFYVEDYKIVSTLALMDLQNAMSLRFQGRHKGFFVYLDEFKDIVYPGFTDLIAKAREAKIGLMLGHQAQGDLEQLGKSFANTVTTNTSNKMIFHLGSSETAEGVSRQFGTKTTKDVKKNYSTQGGLLGGGSVKGYTPTEFEEFLVHPNSLKRLAMGEAFLLIQRRNGPPQTYHAFLDPPPRDLPLDKVLLSKPKDKTIFKPLVFKKTTELGKTKP